MAQPPPSNFLLQDDLAQLQARADSGDAKAACLLGYKLLRCREAEAMAHDPRLMGDAFPPDLDMANRRHLAAMRPTARAFVALCRRAPADARERGYAYARRAALAGEPEAMYRYARGDYLDFGGFGPDDPQFESWLQEAPEMLERSFRAGYLPSLMELWEANLEDSGRLNQLIENDKLKAQALEFLMRRLTGNGELEEGWIRHPEVAHEARARAAKWQAEYFPQRRSPVDLDRKQVAWASELFDPERAIDPDIDTCRAGEADTMRGIPSSGE